MLNLYTTDQLLSMLEKNQFPEALSDNVKETLLYKHYQKDPRSYSLPISKGVMGASICIDFFWTMLYIVDLSLLTMACFLSILGVILIALGAAITWKSYHKSIKEQKALSKNLEMILCQEVILHELLLRQQQKLNKKAERFFNQILEMANQLNKSKELNTVLKLYNLDLTSSNNNQKFLEIATNKQLQADIIHVFTGEKKHLKPQELPLAALFSAPKETKKISKIIKATGEGIGLSYILFGSFYVCSIYIFKIAGFVALSTLLSTPVTIGVVCVTLTACGLFYGYKIYQQSKKSSEQKKIIQDKQQSLNSIKYQYEDTKKLTASLQKMSDKLDNLMLHQTHSTFGSFFNQKQSMHDAKNDSDLNRNESIVLVL